jgi:hypothetical protein
MGGAIGRSVPALRSSRRVLSDKFWVCAQVRLPVELWASGADEHDINDTVTFESKTALYSPKRLSTALAAMYTTHVENALDTHEAAKGARIGACLLEPGVQAAGGMLMLDPLFQKVLARVRSRLPSPCLDSHLLYGPTPWPYSPLLNSINVCVLSHNMHNSCWIWTLLTQDTSLEWR